MTRSEHLEWAKQRALEKEEPSEMWVSFINDLGKHEELKDHIAIGMGNSLGMLTSPKEVVVKFIKGFN